MTTHADKLSGPPATVAPSDPNASLPPNFAPLLAFFPRFGLTAPRIEPLSAEDLPPLYRRMLQHSRNTTFVLEQLWGGAAGLRVLQRVERRAEGELDRWIVLQIPVDERADRRVAAATDERAEQVQPDAAVASPPIDSAAAAAAAASAPSTATAAAPAPSSSASTFQRVVEFGSIRIHVHRLPESLQEHVWAGQVPFATLLARHDPPVPQVVRADCFFRMRWPRDLQRALQLPPEQEMFPDDGAQDPVVYGRCNSIRHAHTGELLCEVVEVMPPVRA